MGHEHALVPADARLHGSQHEARREPLSGCWNLAFERVAPVRGFASFRGQRNRPGLWWFASTGEHVGHESWLERNRLMALDADPEVVGVAAQRAIPSHQDGPRCKLYFRRDELDEWRRSARPTGSAGTRLRAVS